MTVQNASINTGSTVSSTGGTAVTYGPNGQTVSNGIVIVDTAAESFLTQAKITLSSKLPTVKTDGSMTKLKRKAILVEPFVDSKGVLQYDLIRIEREVHPESSAAKALDFNVKGAQLLTDADFTAFWATGNLG
jgi:hypothetical protein